jgi:hypothetical protein
MINSKLHELLNTFDSNLLSQFNQYLNLYRNNKDTINTKLFDYIYLNLSRNNTELLSKEKAFSYLFPSLPYNEKRMLNIMSDLLKLAEEFISYYGFKNNQIEKDILLLQYYLENDLHKFFENKYKNAIHFLDKQKEDYTCQIAKFKIELLQLSYQQRFNKRYTNYASCASALENLSTTQSKKLENLCLINLDKDLMLQHKQSNLSNIHTHLHELLNNNDNYQLYNDIKTSILELTHHISEDELLTITLILINYCIEKVNNKIIGFDIELIYWYDFQINNKIIFEFNGSISSATFKNYITIALRLENPSKAIMFLENFYNYLPEYEFDYVYNYNKANIYFYQYKLEEALELLLLIKTEDIFYKLSNKRLIIKIYYSLCYIQQKNYFDIFESTLNAFKKYIYTTKEINNVIRERNKQFCKFLYKISKIHSLEQSKNATLLQSIISNEQCAERDWLIKLFPQSLITLVGYTN